MRPTSDGLHAPHSIFRDWMARLKEFSSSKMLSESLGSAVSGAVFGAALTAAGVHYPDVIINQFRLADFRMFEVFTVAFSSSALIMLALDQLDIVRRQVRANVPLGLFSRFDGNIIGGALVGLGMSLSGSCPGTVMVQIAQGIPSAKATAVGGLLGGVAHVWINRPIRRKVSRPKSEALPAKRTISDVTGIPETAIYMLVGTAWAALLYFARPHSRSFWASSAAGGLYMGFAQAVSLLLTSTPLGISGLYDQAGRYICRALGSEDIAKPPSPPRAIIFALGMMAGSMTLTGGVSAATTATAAPWPLALAGGFAMAFGAKIACGCTSGHGLSGMGALSFSSLVSVVSMFGAGILSQQYLL